MQSSGGEVLPLSLERPAPSTSPALRAHALLPLYRFEEATHRTTRWIDRCIAAHSRPNEQNLFAIIQVCWGGAGLVL